MENLQNEYQLTTDEKGLLDPIIETVDSLQKEAQTILRAITRLRKLEGQWNLIGDKLVRANAAPAVQQISPPAQLEAVGAGQNGRG